jgi:hypothetical protein
MRIKTISRSEFDRLLPQNPALDNVMVVEVEWFSNRSGRLFGTIAKGEGVAGWNYAILKRDKLGNSHVCKVMNNFFSLKAARVDLLLSMAGIESANREMADFRLPSMPAESFALNPKGPYGRQSKAYSRSGRISALGMGTGAVVP